MTCSSGYFRTDKAECVLACADEIVPAFLSANKTTCLKSCANENTLRETPVAYTCVTTCVDGYYKNAGVCTSCSTTFGADCSKCS